MTNWIAISDRKPKLGKMVLVCRAGDTTTLSIRYLVESHGTMVPSGEKTTHLGWYPGGWDIGWTTHWAELPAIPDVDARIGSVWAGESQILEDGDGSPCVELDIGPTEILPRCPVRVRYRIEEIVE